ncbi:MAG: peptide deformylase [Calditrichaceae bacterium]|nr:peptide deformylase [Calditrichia bacterium]NUQ41944.1 peptide deformylase [Calditrichaceae bacterium]
MKKPLQLKIYPDSVLREKSLPVKDVDEAVRDLMKGMAEIMYAYQGIGLAAPQVGVLQRVIIADIGEGLISLANPEIIDQTGEDLLEEGCLSLPEIQVTVQRKQSIFVRGIDATGKEIARDLDGLTARVIQHEIDHLNGVLIIDYASLIEKYELRNALAELESRCKHPAS